MFLLQFIFDRYTAVFLWKTQSPWPALRGFLYDWYLEGTGMLRGVRSALQSHSLVILDRASWRVRLVNKSIFPLYRKVEKLFQVEYSWVSTNGQVVSRGYLKAIYHVIPPMSALLMGENPIRWPLDCTAVCFLRLSKNPHRSDDHVVWYWLTDPVLGHENDFSFLGKMRRNRAGVGEVQVDRCWIQQLEDRSSLLRLSVVISVPRNASEVLFYPTLSVRRNRKLLLPIFDSSDTHLVIRPGEIQYRELELPQSHGGCCENLEVVLHSWNAATFTSVVAAE